MGIRFAGGAEVKIDPWRSPGLLAVGFGLLLWLVAFACYRAPGVATGHAGPRETLYLAGTAVLGFIFTGLFYLAVARAGRRLPRGARLGMAVGLLVALVLIHASLDLYAIEHYLRARIVLGPRARVTGQGLLFLNNLLTLSPVYLSYAIGLAFGLSQRAVREREQRLAAALAAAQEAQLAALRFQINPHFLFNSLNAVMSLVGSGRNRDAETVVARLAAFFRATLASEPNAMVTLEEELDLLSAYLDIEAARFGDRLKAVIDVPDDLTRAAVPHFLLQPLAENAIKHGVAPSKRPVTLSITARAEAARLLVRIADDGAGGAPASAGGGVGLRNIAGRLRAHYGDAGVLRAERQPRGFVAEVTLPLTFAPPES